MCSAILIIRANYHCPCSTVSYYLFRPCQALFSPAPHFFLPATIAAAAAIDALAATIAASLLLSPLIARLHVPSLLW
jgi:hypothetical protein